MEERRREEGGGKKIRQVEKNASKGSHMWIMMSANAGRQTDTHTHTDNPSDTQTDRQVDTQTSRQTDGWMDQVLIE